MKRVFNSVGDLQQFHNLVLGGYHQVDIGTLPASLQRDLGVLTMTLAEGMQEECKRIRLNNKSSDDSPLVQSQKEFYMDLFRKQVDTFGEKYAEAMEDYSFEKEGY